MRFIKPFLLAIFLLVLLVIHDLAAAHTLFVIQSVCEKYQVMRYCHSLRVLYIYGHRIEFCYPFWVYCK